MAKKKGPGRPATAQAAERATVINLKGPESQRDWLAGISRKTMIPAAAITRAALAEWSKKNGHPPMPDYEGGT